jgi:hypothetical protein
VELNPFAGYLFGGRIVSGSTVIFPEDVNVDDHLTYGGRLGLNLTSLFEIEFHYSRIETSFVTPNDGIFGPGRQTLGDLTLQYFLGYLTFNFGHGRVVPYFTMGAGAANLNPNVPDTQTSSETRFTASAGGGVKFFFTPHFGLRFDGRAYTTSLGDRSHVFCNSDGFCTSQSWLTNWDANGGFIIAF